MGDVKSVWIHSLGLLISIDTLADYVIDGKTITQCFYVGRESFHCYHCNPLTIQCYLHSLGKNPSLIHVQTLTHGYDPAPPPSLFIGINRQVASWCFPLAIQSISKL